MNLSILLCDDWRSDFLKPPCRVGDNRGKWIASKLSRGEDQGAGTNSCSCSNQFRTTRTLGVVRFESSSISASVVTRNRWPSSFHLVRVPRFFRQILNSVADPDPNRHQRSGSPSERMTSNLRHFSANATCEDLRPVLPYSSDPACFAYPPCHLLFLLPSHPARAGRWCGLSCRTWSSRRVPLATYSGT